MSLCILGGVAVGCWAMLSIVSGEYYRQKQQIEAEKEEALRKARLEAENADAELLPVGSRKFPQVQHRPECMQRDL